MNWRPGEDVIIVPAVSDEDAKKKYPGGWKAPRPYLRIVPGAADLKCGLAVRGGDVDVFASK